MGKTERYTIITNDNGQRILVVNELVDIEREDELQDSDFDAIFINISHRSYEENRLVVRWTSPIRVQKCYLKPRFATIALQEYLHFASYLIDGFCSTPFDKSFTDFIQIVYENIEVHKMNRNMLVTGRTTASDISSFIKFDISRGRFKYTNLPIRGLAQGFNKLFLAWYDNQETLKIEERIIFNYQMESLGYAVKDRFIERIHLCPKCKSSHLLYMECCPKCGSSNIQHESLIHHFRCANVSPESTYNYDGELRCPKCHHLLRHIGVDYDRPASVYSCRQCAETFINSSMKVLCTVCGETSTPQQLLPTDVWEFRLTKSGVDAFCSNEALLNIQNENIYSGYSNYEEFLHIISSFSMMNGYKGYVMVVLRYHFHYDNYLGTLRLFDIVRNIVSHLTTIKVTYNGDNLYLLIVTQKDNEKRHTQNTTKIMGQLFQEFSNAGKYIEAKLTGKYIYKQGEDPLAFIKEIEKETPIE
jgi:hypothetical protein